MPITIDTEMRNRLADMIDDYGKPKRSKGTQLLRDAALGREEFPDGTEIYDIWASHAGAALAKKIDDGILDSLKSQIKGV